jgi:hypothetical protein
MGRPSLAPLQGSKQDFATLIAKDYDFRGKVIRDAGIKVDLSF